MYYLSHPDLFFLVQPVQLVFSFLLFFLLGGGGGPPQDKLQSKNSHPLNKLLVLLLSL